MFVKTVERQNGKTDKYLAAEVGGKQEIIQKLPESGVLYEPELHQDKASNITERLPADSIDLILTDPPYGIEFDSNRHSCDGIANYEMIANDSTLEYLHGLPEQFCEVLRPNSHVYVFTRWDAYPPMADYFIRSDLELNTVIVWDKIRHGMGDLRTWSPRHEFIMHFEYGNPQVRGKRPQNLIELELVLKHQAATVNGEIVVHPTQKPVELLKRIIEKSSDVGDTVFDPFGGSYSTARAAFLSGRKSVSCELDPETHRAGEQLVKDHYRKHPYDGTDLRDLDGVELEPTSIARRGVMVDGK